MSTTLFYQIAVVEDITARKRLEEQRDKLIEDLQFALVEVKTLGGLLPICAHCKNIRDDKGYWGKIETYIHDHSGTDFTHVAFQRKVDRFKVY